LGFNSDRLAVPLPWYGLKTPFALPSGGAKDEHPLQIPSHGHKAPLAADTVDPAQQKLPAPIAWESLAHLGFQPFCPPRKLDLTRFGGAG
jgi:hypothetical protein